MSWSFDFIFAAASCVRVWHVKRKMTMTTTMANCCCCCSSCHCWPFFRIGSLGTPLLISHRLLLKQQKHWVGKKKTWCSFYAPFIRCSTCRFSLDHGIWCLIESLISIFSLLCHYSNLNTHSNAFIKPFHFIHLKFVWDEALFVYIFCFYSYGSPTNTDDWSCNNVWNEYFIHPLWFDLQKLTIDFQYLPYYQTLFT